MEVAPSSRNAWDRSTSSRRTTISPATAASCAKSISKAIGPLLVGPVERRRDHVAAEAVFDPVATAVSAVPEVSEVSDALFGGVRYVTR